jgi:hypothetical protein
MDIEAAIEIAKLLVTTAEGLAGEIGKAKTALESGTAQLKNTLAEAQKLKDQLAADRKSADDALDKKFDKGGQT